MTITAGNSVYLTHQEACAYLKCVERTLVRYVDRGLITVYRTPTGRKRYRLEDVERLVGAR